MKTSDWVIFGIIILGAWVAFWGKEYEISINCALSALIIFTFKNNNK